MMPAKSISPCLRFVRRVTNAFLQAGGHDATCYPSLSIHHATPGHVSGEFTIAEHNLNRLSTLHGGLICSLVDTMGSLALASKGLYSTGVSTDIHTTFVKVAGGGGDVVKVDGKVISMGKTLATTKIELRHPVSDMILAYGSHTKFVGKALTHPENVGAFAKEDVGLSGGAVLTLCLTEFDESGSKVIKGKPTTEWAEQ